ncbi:MAG: hypothetical protein LBO64_00035 [Desulfovibrio sp.]|jgi:hypothetical protein|nr:hypothetical protein [Desulfovibrio sp.]
MLTFTILAIFLAVWLAFQKRAAYPPAIAATTSVGYLPAVGLTTLGITSESHVSRLDRQAVSYFQALSAEEQKLYTFPLSAIGKKVSGSVKTQNVTLFRWQRVPELALGHDHVSFLLNSQGKLAGFSRMIPAAAASPLPNEKTAEQKARGFLQIYAPDLLPVMNVQWIKPHTDEQYSDGQNQYRINGMKVKYRNRADRTYFWVIIGSDNSVIVFERDIEWDFIRAGRQTEKWLHDDWLQKYKISFIKNCPFEVLS